MNELQIILDKSVVFGLTNQEIDTLDRYFFQIVPPILTNELLADLAKEADAPSIKKKISQHSYRISGNRGIPVNYWKLLANCMMGNKIPMNGRFLPAGQTTVRTEDGSIGTNIETLFEDDTIARWESGNFTDREREFATSWRKRMETPLYPNSYIGNIKKAGLDFTAPKSDKDLVEMVDSLLLEPTMQHRLFPQLARTFGIPQKGQEININRWFKEGRPMFKDFAPYAFFCLRASFIWALGLTNTGLFQPDKNDRKDLEYCYYLPHCEIFASNDKKHKRLIPYMLNEDQSFVVGDELKEDLHRLWEKWESLSREERIKIHTETRGAPIEDENSIVFRLWRKHRGQFAKRISEDAFEPKSLDSPMHKDHPFRETLSSLMERMKPVAELPYDEARNTDGTDFVVRRTRVSKERLLKRFPHLTPADLEEKDKE